MVDITVASDFFGRRGGAREGFGRAVGRNEESIRKCYVRTDENNFLLFLLCLFLALASSSIEKVTKLLVSLLPPAGGSSSLPRRHDILAMPLYTAPWSRGLP